MLYQPCVFFFYKRGWGEGGAGGVEEGIANLRSRIVSEFYTYTEHVNSKLLTFPKQKNITKKRFLKTCMYVHVSTYSIR